MRTLSRIISPSDKASHRPSEAGRCYIHTIQQFPWSVIAGVAAEFDQCARERGSSANKNARIIQCVRAARRAGANECGSI